jgi:hypothetical protein
VGIGPALDALEMGTRTRAATRCGPIAAGLRLAPGLVAARRGGT